MYLPTHSFNIFEAYLIMEPTSGERDHSSQAGAELSTQASLALCPTVSRQPSLTLMHVYVHYKS